MVDLYVHVQLFQELRVIGGPVGVQYPGGKYTSMATDESCSQIALLPDSLVTNPSSELPAASHVLSATVAPLHLQEFIPQAQYHLRCTLKR